MAGTLVRGSRYESLDMWRGVACLLVLLFHSAFYVTEHPGVAPPDGGMGWAYVPVVHGYVGVGMFFVISGYCIAQACESARKRGRPGRDFFVRRVRRIYPPYLIVLGLSAVGVVGLTMAGMGHAFVDGVHDVPDPKGLSAWQWLGNVTLTEQWRPRVVGDAGAWVVGQAWSLCYEEQFYLVCGLVLVLWPRRFYAVLFVLTVAVGILTAYQFRYGAIEGISGFFFDGWWLLFGAGVAVFYRLKCASAGEARVLDACLVVAALIGSAVAVRYGGWHHIDRAVAFVFAGVLVVLYRWDREVAGSRWVRPLNWCGEMCYSLYLIQWPLVKVISRGMWDLGIRGEVGTLLVTVPVCAGVSIVAARGFYLLVERRFLNTGVREEKKGAQVGEVSGLAAAA